MKDVLVKMIRNSYVKTETKDKSMINYTPVYDIVPSDREMIADFIEQQQETIKLFGQDAKEHIAVFTAEQHVLENKNKLLINALQGYANIEGVAGEIAREILKQVKNTDE